MITPVFLSVILSFSSLYQTIDLNQVGVEGDLYITSATISDCTSQGILDMSLSTTPSDLSPEDSLFSRNIGGSQLPQKGQFSYLSADGGTTGTPLHASTSSIAYLNWKGSQNRDGQCTVIFQGFVSTN